MLYNIWILNKIKSLSKISCFLLPKLTGSMDWNEKFNFMHANVTLINRGFREWVNQICRTEAVANGHDCFSFDNNT